MRNAVHAEMNYSGAKPQTTIFENSVTKQRQNIIYTEEFLASLPGTPIISTQNNSIFWENIPLSVIYNKLLNKRFSFSSRSRVFNEIESFCEWIKQVLKDNTLNNWTVIVAGRDPVDDPQRRNTLGYWDVAGHSIGKVNRSKRNIEDETCIDIGVLRSIKDLLADIDKDYLEGYGNITKQEQVDEIRHAAGKDTVPMLLIYRISGQSTARQSTEDTGYKEGIPDRVDLNYESDIIGIQICIPGDQVNKSFVKKVTVYLPDKDKEDEVEEKHGN